MNIVTNFLTQRVKDYAIANWRTYSFKQEWLSIILLVLVVKIATSAVSVFSGYYYLIDVFRGLFGNITLQKTFAVLSLVLIELLNALFLAKAFKFILRLNNAKWIFPMCLSAGLFVISFVVSTNGIAIYTSDKVDISNNIAEKYENLITQLNTETAANIDLVKNQIQNIKENPTDWKDGKRCILSAAQLNEINKCYDKITAYQTYKEQKIRELTHSKTMELADNQAVTTNTASRYYIYVSVIMALQIVSSFLLWFFWCKISMEDDKENAERETIETSLNDVLDTVDDCIYKRIDNRIGVLHTIYSGIAAQSTENTIKAETTTENTTETTPQKKVIQIAGFNSDTQTPQTPQKKPFKVGDTANVTTVHGTPQNVVKTCLNCGNTLTAAKLMRGAKYCCDACRVAAYNKAHPNRRPIIIAAKSLK